MKNQLAILLFIKLLLLVSIANANTYYVSTSGNDSNPGTIGSPFATWQKGFSVLAAGDILYIRGGTYQTPNISTDYRVYMHDISGTSGSHIRIENYPGEKPVLDFSNITQTTNSTGVRINNCNWIDWKGLRITGLAQQPNGNGVVGWINDGCHDVTFTLFEVDHIGGNGFRFINGAGNYYVLNSDFHHCADQYNASPYNDADGFDISYGVQPGVVEGCRAWWNSDDGFDVFGNDGMVTFKNCWSFWNGYIPGTFNSAGNGNGFKWGLTTSDLRGSIRRRYQNCLAYKNKTSGFDQNVGRCDVEFYNNTSYQNEAGWTSGWGLSPTATLYLRNNVSYQDGIVITDPSAPGDHNHNTWDLSLTATDADFQSVNSTGIDGPRQSDGSLPVINFLHPASNSKLINAGVNIGLSFIGSAPDLGYFQASGAASVNQSPVANAGSNQIIILPVSLTVLTGSGSDPDGTIASYQWTKIAGPALAIMLTPNLPTTTVTTLVQGIYQFELKVTDNQGAIGKDTVTVNVNSAPNQLPAANAGADKTITLPINNVTLTGNGTDPDGTIAIYQWNKISGPSQFTIASPTQAQTLISGLVQGTYQFELRVTDNLGGIGKDTVKVTVNAAANQLPTAIAGTDKIITLPTNNTTLTGSAVDADGTITSYQWSKVSGPTQFTISSSSQSQTAITNLVQGLYQFELKVTDNLGAIGKDTVLVTVNVAANQSPIANAGVDISITLPTSSTTLTGTGTDPDGTIATYRWTKIAGPLQFSIISRNSAQTAVNSLVQGNYQFELQVTDNLGRTATDTVAVTVNAAPPLPNQHPIANTGADKTITLPTNTVTVTGSGIDADGTIASYQWNKVSGPSQFAIASPTQAQTAINNLVQGIYLFELTVADNLGALGKDTMIVTVNIAPPPVTNQSPIANAGSDISITLPTNSTTLTGSGTDQDGLIASYRWTKIAGPNQFTITSRSQAQTSITNLKQGIYQFELQVTDNQNATGKDTVIVTVNAAPATNKKPSASAGSDKKITLPTNSTTLTGSANDSDGTIISYQWSKVSGPSQPAITSPDQTQTQITNLAQGVYSFELKVTDDQGAVAADTIMITVIAPPNQLPAANAGNDITITLPTNSAGLSGNGTDLDGTIVTYRWTKIAGPNLFIITSRNEAQTTVTNLTQGVYQFELQVTDNAGAIAKDTVTITVLAAPNLPPVANAGFDNNLTLPANSVILTGSGIDADGTIVSYQWNKVSGPAQFTIVSPTQAQTTINNLVQGVYSFELTVTDNQGATAKDIVTISVNPAPPASNQSPIANAGTDKTITLPANSVILTGNGTDADGTIASYQWNKVSGPAQFTIASPNQGQTLISGLVQGIYQFELTVTDNKGATGKATVTITVNPASGTSSNQPPVANAGTDKSITLPSNSVTLSGGGTDPDGTIASYQWSKVSGPAQFTIISPSQAQTLITGLVQGTYQFQLTVTDNKGATGKATVTIVVNPVAGASSNQSPVVNAGPDIRIILPTDSATLTGSATDPDGTIIAYQWAKVSGPATYTITSADKPQATVSNLVEGTYQFELKVTDNKGAVGKDIVSVVVLNQGSKISTISAYPNPATTTLNVRLEPVANPDLITMNIYDARGMIIRQEQFMRSQQAMTRQIDISRYTNGMYVLELGNDLNREMLKFVKQ